MKRSRSTTTRRPSAMRSARPGCEALEGRALMATSAFDPTFGTRGAALGPVDPGLGSALSVATAVAVDAAGRVVVAGTNNSAVAYGAQTVLAVRRYAVDGTPDATFGVGGQATIPLPAGAVGVKTAPRSVSFGPDGSIVVAAALATTADGPYATLPYEGLVARLTPAGQLDAGFAAGGTFVAADADGTSFVAAAQADGSIVFGGSVQQGNTITTVPQYLVGRLTPAGALDPAFNGTGTLQVPAAYTFNGGTPFQVDIAVTSIAIDPSGNVDLGANVSYSLFSKTVMQNGTLVRVGAGGTLDAAFGASGIATTRNLVSAIAAQPDGKIVALGSRSVERYLATGAFDFGFAPQASNNAAGSAPASDLYNALALGADGSITVAGSTNGGDTLGNSAVGARLLVARYTAAGAVDTSFGVGGRLSVSVASAAPANTAIQVQAVNALALTATGDVVAAGAASFGDPAAPNYPVQSLVARLRPVKLAANATDYDGDGRSDPAIQLADLALFSAQKSTGGYTQTPFGAAGPGATIPAPGDYDGDGIPDVAAYLPAYGILAYRPSSGGADVYFAFGSAGQGASIPAPGDYDGDGKTDVAVYLPAFGALAVHPSGGGANQLIPFGSAGVNGSVPAPGDYDGDGITDVAVYLPAFGALAVRPSSGTPNYLVTFGSAGVGASIPVPGDYDGDGKTDVAVYLPAFGALAVRPSAGGLNQLTTFGSAGAGASIPAPGDYDGDGKTDVAVYLPQYGTFAIDPSGGGAPYLVPYGHVNQTVPATSIPYAFGPTVAASALPSSGASAGFLVALTDDLLPSPPGARKSKA